MLMILIIMRENGFVSVGSVKRKQDDNNSYNVGKGTCRIAKFER